MKKTNTFTLKHKTSRMNRVKLYLLDLQFEWKWNSSAKKKYFTLRFQNISLISSNFSSKEDVNVRTQQKIQENNGGAGSLTILSLKYEIICDHFCFALNPSMLSL